MSRSANNGPGGPIDWELAQRVAARFARRQPFAAAASSFELTASYTALTDRAEAEVAAHTGLASLAGPARARVTDRPGWVDANLASFQRLLHPLIERFVVDEGTGEPERPGGRLSGTWQRASAKASGAQLGALLGWMSTRVLGQYDLLVIEDQRADEQDLVYYVGPNLLAMERRYAFPPQEFRFWVALHECTHRAQFTGVPWLRGYFLEQVQGLLGSLDPDPNRLLEALKRTVTEVRAGERPLERGGLAAVLATPEQRQVLERLSGLMSLLEGHGEVVMNRAGAGSVPSAWRFEQVLRNRREAARGFSRLLSRLVGLEAKLNQYAEGERFITAVEAKGGRDLFDQVWAGPQNVPTLAEIREPRKWIERVDGSGASEDPSTPAR
ncbi:MAG: zinc-dependent metalloprotease [Acidimicrobiales bacterium]